jgi:hypothetical protein
MAFLPGANNPTRDRRVEYSHADEERARKRTQDAAGIDPTAAKWRYRPTNSVTSIKR